MNDIKLFITDIDGVWTDGGMYYDNNGNEWKKFNTSDSAGVMFLKLLQIPVAIITGEQTPIVERRAKKLGIDELYMGVKHKVSVAEGICAKMGITLEQVAYIGDDINDIQLLKLVGLSAAPSNAPDYIQSVVHWRLPVAGGDGAFRAFVERYLHHHHLMELVLKKFHEQTEWFRQ